MPRAISWDALAVPCPEARHAVATGMTRTPLPGDIDVAHAFPITHSSQAVPVAISLSSLGTSYTQDFNSLATTGPASTTPPDWVFAETGSNANATYSAGTGSGNAGDTYSFGASASTDRAFGGLRSGSLVPTIGASFVNGTGVTVTSLVIDYTGEQWRQGVSNRGAADRLDFQYSLDATSLTTGTWINVDALDFLSPNITAAVGALDGNAAANRTAVSSSITGLSLANGATVWIRWTDFDISSSDDGLAVDDFSITPQAGAALPSVNLSVSSNAGSEAGQTVITVTATASTVVTGDQTVSVGVAGTGITAGDYTLSNTTITIPSGQTIGTVTFTIVDDLDPESSETAALTISNPSLGIALGGTVSQNVVIADNDSPPSVDLSVSAASGSEAAATSIVVTATASAAVVGNQTVTLGVSGTGITAADYYLTGTTITIPAGQTTGSVTFVIADDAVVEATETATLTISTPSAGISLGANIARTVAITDNTGSFLTKIAGATSTNGAEIPAFDPASDKLFVVAGSALEVYTMAGTGALTPTTPLLPGFTPDAGSIAVPNSVAVKNGVVAVAWASVNTTTNAQGVGHVTLYSAATGAVLKDLSVGYLPDMLTFTPDGSKVVVANEGEPNSYNQASSFDPVGSVSVIDLLGGAASATVQDAGFSAFDSQIATLKAQGVRIFGPNATVSQDLEPEYVTITPDGLTAIVTLQENNAAAVVDLATATVVAIAPLGTKDFSLPGNGFDASDRDGAGGTTAINIQNWPVKGMYMPDAIANFTVGGQTYYITANEGDSRSYTGFSEEVRVNSSSYVLDPTVFPNASTLKLDANLGRLQLTNASGDTDGDLDFDQIMAFGGRSFTIWDPVGTPVYDSGDDLEQITAARSPTLFNSDGTASSFDTRSDNKGAEPEGVAVGVIGGRTYAFIGSERSGDVMVFDVSVPTAPTFVQYINMPEDVSPEGLSFVAAADSPTGKPLLITANEVSKTVAVFEVAVPVRIADIQGAAHLSPLNGQAVRDVVGKVTAIASNGFWIQDPTPDANPATSDGIFVFTGSGNALLTARSLGEPVKVSGTVSEFRAAGDADNLTLTEIVNNAGVQALVVSAWTDAPAGSIAPIVLGVDRIAPTSVISAPGNVETQPVFDPAAEGIDFWESLEGMLVQVNNPVATSPTNGNGEIWVLPDNGAGATSVTARGGSLITPSDFNPERVQLDNLVSSQVLPSVDVGARLNSVTGVVDYSFNNFDVRVLATPTVAQASTLPREVTNLTNSANQLTVATFNVENLDPGDGAAKFNSLAAAIVGNLKSPDILNLEEVQDNSGSTNNGVVDATVTIETLIAAIAGIPGAPTYEYRQLNPENNKDGGEPGGNIRVVFLFNPDRVSFVEGTLQRLTDPTPGDLNDPFEASRKPLVGDFVFNGETVTVIGNHFNSKGGDDPLFGPTQPPVLSSEVQRNAQADIVGDFIDAKLAAKPGAYVVVAGDLNDFEFSNPVTRLEGSGMTSLIETLPANERYSYNFEGNAQTLDHLMASGGLLHNLDGYDVVHINSEFAVQVSDHDPVVARFDIAPGQTLVGTGVSNTLVGGAGNDTLTGLQGRDRLTGGAGADKFVYTSLLDAGDVITDFEVGIDMLVIGQLLASVGYSGSDPVGAGYLGVTSSAGRTLVTFDADGSAGAGAARQLVELTGVTSVLPAELIDLGA